MDDENEQEQDLPVRNLVLSVCDLKQHGEAPVARCAAQTVMVNTRMYLHGGCDEKQAFGDLHLLEMEQMRWTQLKTNGVEQKPRWAHTMNVHGADLVVFGGLIGSGDALGSDTGTPASVGNPPFAGTLQWSHSGVPDNSIFTLDPQNLTWNVPVCSGSAPSPRFFHSACVAGDLYIIFGGSSTADYSKPLDDIHWLDLGTNTWSAPAVSGQAPPPRFAQKMICGPENRLFVFGGMEGQGLDQANPATLYAFDLPTSTWSTVQVAGTAPLERSFHSFDFIGRWGYAFAGTVHSGMGLYILDTNKMRWVRPLYEGQVNVRAHASSVLQEHLVVFGGVRDKYKSGAKQVAKDFETRVSKKLFFLNVLEVKTGAAEGDFKFKLVTVGDSGVGKSCLLTRFVQDYYSDFHMSTIGVDFKTVITMVKGRLVKLQLWDTAGQERFSVVTGNYYRNSDGFVFVYDATSRSSFDHVEQWMNQVQQHHECGPGIVKILVGNKTDLSDQVVVSEEEGRAKANAMGAIFVATSAKTAANVDMAFLSAAQSLVEARRHAKQQPIAQSAGGGATVVPGKGPVGDASEKAMCGCV